MASMELSWFHLQCKPERKAINASHVSSLSMCSLNLKSPLPSPFPFSCSFFTSSWIHLNPYGKPKMKASLSVMLCTFTVWLCMRAALPCPSLTDLFFQGIFFLFRLCLNCFCWLCVIEANLRSKASSFSSAQARWKGSIQAPNVGGQLKSDHGGFLASGSRHF